MKQRMMLRWTTLLCLALMLIFCSPALAAAYEMAIPPLYDDASDFSEGLAAVQIGDMWGFIDKTGELVIAPQYANVHNFHEGVAAVMVGEADEEKWGFIDKTGQEIIPAQYEKVEDFESGIAPVLSKVGDASLWGFIDQAGNEIVPPKYQWVYDFDGGMFKVSISDPELDRPNRGKFGLVDTRGNEIVPAMYDNIGVFREGLASVMQNDRVGFVDSTGAFVIPISYDAAALSIMSLYTDAMPYFSEGLAAIGGGEANGNKYGYIDKNGDIVIPFEYDFAAPFSDGLAYVSRGNDLTFGEFGKGTYGFIDRSGDVVVPFVYDCNYGECGGIIHTQYFKNGYSIVSKIVSGDMQHGMVNSSGEIAIPFQYDWIEYSRWGETLSDPLAFVGYGTNFAGWLSWTGCGIADMTGKEIVPVGYYNDIDPFREGLSHVWFGHAGYDGEEHTDEYDNSLHGFIDQTGKEVVPCIFEDARSFTEGLAAVCIDGAWGYIAIDDASASDSRNASDS